MSTKQADLMSEFVFGNRRILIDTLEEEIVDLSKAATLKSSLLDYVTKLQVSPADISTLLVDAIPSELLKTSSNEAIEFRRADIKAKQEEYRRNLNNYLVSVIV